MDKCSGGNDSVGREPGIKLTISIEYIFLFYQCVSDIILIVNVLVRILEEYLLQVMVFGPCSDLHVTIITKSCLHLFILLLNLPRGMATFISFCVSEKYAKITKSPFRLVALLSSFIFQLDFSAKI